MSENKASKRRVRPEHDSIFLWLLCRSDAANATNCLHLISVRGLLRYRRGRYRKSHGQPRFRSWDRVSINRVLHWLCNGYVWPQGSMCYRTANCGTCNSISALAKLTFRFVRAKITDKCRLHPNPLLSLHNRLCAKRKLGSHECIHDTGVFRRFFSSDYWNDLTAGRLWSCLHLLSYRISGAPSCPFRISWLERCP